MIFHETIASPVGPVTVWADAQAIFQVTFTKEKEAIPNELTRAAAAWIAGYFEGKREPVRFPAQPQGTNFQQRVWKAAAAIPYGHTATYQEVARMTGSPGAARAVGQALRRNPLPLLIPCHRVIRADGRSGGYAGDKEDWKMLLLKLEQKGHL